MASEYLEDVVEFEEATAVGETDLAIKVKCPDFPEEGMWVPKSNKVLHEDSEVWKKFSSGKLRVYRWWAEKKGLV